MEVCGEEEVDPENLCDDVRQVDGLDKHVGDEEVVAVEEEETPTSGALHHLLSATTTTTTPTIITLQ